jgi:hypothetical protein
VSQLDAPAVVSIDVEDDNDDDMSSSLEYQSQEDASIDPVVFNSSSSSSSSSNPQRRPIFSIGELKQSDRMELSGSYPWLLFDGGFACKECRECRSDPDVHSKRNKWITARSQLQRRYADEHQSSRSHKTAHQALLKRQQQQHVTLDSQFGEQRHQQLTHLKVFIATAYFLAVRQMPTIHYQPMLELMAQLRLVVPEMYRSRQACGLFQELISQMLKDELTVILKDQMYGLIIDESTDIVAQKTLIVYID